MRNEMKEVENHRCSVLNHPYPLLGRDSIASPVLHMGLHLSHGPLKGDLVMGYISGIKWGISAQVSDMKFPSQGVSLAKKRVTGKILKNIWQ